MAKAKGVAAKPPSPIPLQLFGPQQQALFDALVATAKPPAEAPTLASPPPKTRAAVKARPAKKNEQGPKVDMPPVDVDPKPRASALKPTKPRAPKRKREPEDETTASDDSKADEVKRKKAVAKEAKRLEKPKSGSKVSATFYKTVGDDAGLTGQDIKKALLSTQKVVGESLKTQGKSRMPSFLTFKCKVIKQRPAKDKNLFGNIVKLPERPEKKAALTIYR